MLKPTNWFYTTVDKGGWWEAMFTHMHLVNAFSEPLKDETLVLWEASKCWLSRLLAESNFFPNTEQGMNALAAVSALWDVNSLQEYSHTKQLLWRIIAEKGILSVQNQ